MISHKIDEDGILQVVFSGNISYKDILYWLDDFSKIECYSDHVNLLYDIRNANFLLDMVNLIEVSKKTEETTLRFEKVRTVFLIEESKLTNYSELFSFLCVKGKTIRKIFSDVKDAHNWLTGNEN